MNEKDWLRPKDAAVILGCSEYSLRDMVRRGVIPSYRVGVKIFLRTQTVLAWIEQEEAKTRNRKENLL